MTDGFLVFVPDSLSCARYRIVSRQGGILQTLNDIIYMILYQLLLAPFLVFLARADGRAQDFRSFISRSRIGIPRSAILSLSFSVYIVSSSQCTFEDSGDQTENNFQGNIASTVSDMVIFYK